mmetsp:Transcript_30397/g.76159  ORF Transcript_30397/g.76159 Transcript_30397/m.76159 type:complete len:211 (-) Transcript_30397:3146-3778(-)
MISTAPSPSLPISAGDRTLALTNRTEALKDGVTRTLAVVAATRRTAAASPWTSSATLLLATPMLAGAGEEGASAYDTAKCSCKTSPASHAVNVRSKSGIRAKAPGLIGCKRGSSLTASFSAPSPAPWTLPARGRPTSPPSKTTTREGVEAHRRTEATAFAPTFDKTSVRGTASPAANEIASCWLFVVCWLFLASGVTEPGCVAGEDAEPD